MENGRRQTASLRAIGLAPLGLFINDNDLLVYPPRCGR